MDRINIYKQSYHFDTTVIGCGKDSLAIIGECVILSLRVPEKRNKKEQNVILCSFLI